MNFHEIQLAKRLFELGAVQFGAFKLREHQTNPQAPLSPIFLNVRTPDNPKPGPLDQETVGMIGEMLYDKANAERLVFQLLAGVPRAGEPLARAFLDAAIGDGCDYGVLELCKNDDGETRHITGLKKHAALDGGDVLLIDDLITKADSKFEAIKVLEREGGRVRDVLVLVDREQGGTIELTKAGYRLHSIFTLRALIAFYQKEGLITAAKEDEVLLYLAANRP